MDRRELNEQVQGPPRELSKFSRRNKALFVFVTCVREGVAGRPREAQGGGPPSSEWSMTSRDLFNFLAATHGGSDGVSVDEKKTQISCHQSQSNNVVIDCLTAVLYGRLRVEPFKNRLAKEPGTGRRSVHALFLTDNIRRHLITNICNNGLFGVFTRRSSVKYALGIVHVYDHLRNNAVLRPYMQRQQAQWEKNRDTLEELAISVYE